MSDAARELALSRLPETYARLLRLRDGGMRGAPLAAALAVDREALPALERVADAKLAAALAER